MRLPTREEALQITENSEAFYVTERIIEGQKVEMYDYRLASLSDFVDNDAFELRGLTFVYDEDSNEWDRNILLNKFFNINQCSMDDELELNIGGQTILVNETHVFRLENGKSKMARDLTENDDIKSW